MQYEVEVNGRPRDVRLRHAEGRSIVTIGDRTWAVNAVQVDAQTWSLLVESGDAGGAVLSHEVLVVPDPVTGQLIVHLGAAAVPVSLNGRRRRQGRDDPARGVGPVRILAPMPGKVVRVLAEPGTAVTARQAIVVIEAMKMENELRAGRDGVVTEVPVRPGQSVEAGMLLAVVIPSETP